MMSATTPPPPPLPPLAAEDIPQHLRELSEALPLTLSPDDAAKVLHVTPRTVRKFITIGLLRASRTRNGGGSVRYIIPRSELVRYLMEHDA